MSCSPIDLRDYVLDEVDDNQRRLAEQHLNGCAACREELNRLELTRAALATVPDEEIPQRIGFVSDRVFEPSWARRTWRTFWGSAARLSFASVAMLSVALVVSALLMRPAPAPAPQAVAQVDTSKLEAEFQARLEKAVNEVEARQKLTMAAALEAADQRYARELHSLQLAAEENFSLMNKRLKNMYLASNEYEVRSR